MTTPNPNPEEIYALTQEEQDRVTEVLAPFYDKCFDAMRREFGEDWFWAALKIGQTFWLEGRNNIKLKDFLWVLSTKLDEIDLYDNIPAVDHRMEMKIANPNKHRKNLVKMCDWVEKEDTALGVQPHNLGETAMVFIAEHYYQERLRGVDPDKMRIRYLADFTAIWEHSGFGLLDGFAI